MARGNSGLKQRFYVTFTDGRELAVKTSARDVLEWEAKHRKGFFDSPAPSFETMCWLSWKALGRTSQFVGTFEQFVDQIDDLAPDTEPDETDTDFPTSLEATAEPSLS